MRIVVKGADFSNLGLGNSKWYKNYIKNAGITDENTIEALSTLYNSFVDAGFVGKFTEFHLYTFGDSFKDRFNLINPVLVDDGTSVFINDSPDRHSNLGFQCSPTPPRRIISATKITSTEKFHLHVFNSTPQTAGYIAGLFTESDGNDCSIIIQRGSGQTTAAAIGRHSDFANIANRVTAPDGYPGEKTGLISAFRTDDTVTLTDDGTVLGQKSGFLQGVLAGNMGITCGSIGATNTETDATIAFFGFGNSDWNIEDEVNLNNMVKAFLEDIGD